MEVKGFSLYIEIKDTFDLNSFQHGEGLVCHKPMSQNKQTFSCSLNNDERKLEQADHDSLPRTVEVHKEINNIKSSAQQSVHVCSSHQFSTACVSQPQSDGNFSVMSSRGITVYSLLLPFSLGPSLSRMGKVCISSSLFWFEMGVLVSAAWFAWYHLHKGQQRLIQCLKSYCHTNHAPKGGFFSPESTSYLSLVAIAAQTTTSAASATMNATMIIQSR